MLLEQANIITSRLLKICHEFPNQKTSFYTRFETMGILFYFGDKGNPHLTINHIVDIEERQMIKASVTFRFSIDEHCNVEVQEILKSPADINMSAFNVFFKELHKEDLIAGVSRGIVKRSKNPFVKLSNWFKNLFKKK